MNSASQQDSSSSTGPTRRCVVCRNTTRKASLLRFVVLERTVLFDARKKAPGRGIHVCASPRCLEVACQHGFRRAHKGPLEQMVFSSFIEEKVLPGLHRVQHELMSVARNQGVFIVGAAGVEASAKADELAGYVLARDGSEATRNKYERNASRKGLPVVARFAKEELSRLIGRENVVVAGFKSGQLSEKFLEIERQISALTIVDDELPENE